MMYSLICKNDSGKYVQTNGEFDDIKKARIYQKTISPARNPMIVHTLKLEHALKLNNK